MTSRNVSPSLTSSSDFGPVMPMLVPRPPLSLIDDASARALARARLGVGQVVGVGQLLDGLDLGLGQQPVSPARSRS